MYLFFNYFRNNCKDCGLFLQTEVEQFLERTKLETGRESVTLIYFAQLISEVQAREQKVERRHCLDLDGKSRKIR